MLPQSYNLQNPTYNVVETLNVLSIGRNSLYKLIKNGEINPIRIGKRTLFTSAEIARFLNSRQDRANV